MSALGRAKTIGVLLAAGEGTRTGGRKQFRKVARKSILQRAAEGLLAVREIGGLVVVVPMDVVANVQRELEAASLARPFEVVAGGATRNESSRIGVGNCPSSCEYVLIHDAARPFVSPKLIRRVLKAARAVGAAVPAIEVHDSILESGDDGSLRRYLSREKLRAVQTPQAFATSVINSAFAKSRRRDFTDDASAVKSAGHAVSVVEGEVENRKITTPEQLEAALKTFRRIQ